MDNKNDVKTTENTTENNTRKMVLGVALGNNFGYHDAAWRMPHHDPGAYTDIGATVEQVQRAERGGLQFVFFPDRLFMRGDVTATPPIFNMDPLITLSALTHATNRIGLIGTLSTSFSEPYMLARHLKVLDVYSRGRVGWNAVPSYEPDAFANFGKPLPPREKKYDRLHETLQIVQALWGSWGYEAGKPDQFGMYADPTHIRPVNMQGNYVGSRGPLPVPPSEQGQPVIMMPASSGYGLQAAGMYANTVIGMPSTLEESRALRNTLRQAAVQAGRNPDDIKLVIFTFVSTGETVSQALEERRTLDDIVGINDKLAHLSAFLGLYEPFTNPDEPLTVEQLAKVRAHPQDARSVRAVELAKAGWSPRDIIAHNVFDTIPSAIGTAEQIADQLQKWFEAGAADGFALNFDDFSNGIDKVVENVIPILRERGLFEDDSEPKTLRDHFGLPLQYGLDPRVVANSGDK
jgi:FMN-dependent oxidoreductase (nitrilotriacetate monooxygenase family)